MLLLFNTYCASMASLNFKNCFSSTYINCALREVATINGSKGADPQSFDFKKETRNTG